MLCDYIQSLLEKKFMCLVHPLAYDIYTSEKFKQQRESSGFVIVVEDLRLRQLISSTIYYDVNSLQSYSQSLEDMYLVLSR